MVPAYRKMCWENGVLTLQVTPSTHKGYIVCVEIWVGAFRLNKNKVQVCFGLNVKNLRPQVGLRFEGECLSQVQDRMLLLCLYRLSNKKSFLVHKEDTNQ